MMKLTCGNIENFKDFSQFKNLEDFNNNMEQWMLDVKGEFTKSELIALKRLTRFACKIVGVCNAKIQTIVASTHANNELGGISRSTFERMLRKAKKLGLLHVYHTTKINGYKAHNVYVFNRYERKQTFSENYSDTYSSIDNNQMNLEQNYTETTPVIENVAYLQTRKNQLFSYPPSKEVYGSEKVDVSNETIDLSKTGKQISTKRQTSNCLTALHVSFTSSRVPKQFVHLAGCFFHKASTIEELWKIITISNYHTKYDLPTMIDLACESLLQLVRHMKRHTVKKSIFALYWGIVQNKMDELLFRDLTEMGFAVN